MLAGKFWYLTKLLAKSQHPALLLATSFWILR